MNRFPTLGDRMKDYEEVSKYRLPRKMPVMIRVDGKCFHTYTKKMQKPFDLSLTMAMVSATEKTAAEMMNFRLAYHQSDEVTFFLLDTSTQETEAWFNNELQKIVSITASLFTSHFNEAISHEYGFAQFDARAWTMPLEEVPNNFIWRQRDWERNSIQMVAREEFSAKELHKKSCIDIIEMLRGKGVQWEDTKKIYKYGTFVTPERARIHEKLSYEQISQLLILNP